MKKKILIITYYWPPSGGPGVQRILKFVKYLDRAGYELIVLTVKEGEYPAKDGRLEKEIPERCTVYKTKSIEFFNLFKRISGKKKQTKIDTYILDQKNIGWLGKLSRWIRLNVFIPDGRVGWKFSAIKMGYKIIQEEQPDVIFSSSPPHSLQLIAHKLAQKTGIPWVADFRDPWTQAFWDKGHTRNRMAAKYNANLERKVLNAATRVITVSEGVKSLLPLRDKKKISIISNGYDHEEFGEPLLSENDKFTIVYTGYMANSQCPDSFFNCIAQLPEEMKAQIKIDFYGRQDAAVWRQIQHCGIEELVEDHGYIPHELAIQKMKGSDLLLLLIPKKYGKGILTGKLFEYLATHHFILGFGDPHGNAADVLRQCEAGVMMAYDEDPNAVIVERWNCWKNKVEFHPNAKEIEKYTRSNLTKQLINVLECV